MSYYNYKQKSLVLEIKLLVGKITN